MFKHSKKYDYMDERLRIIDGMSNMELQSLVSAYRDGKIHLTPTGATEDSIVSASVENGRVCVNVRGETGDLIGQLLLYCVGSVMASTQTDFETIVNYIRDNQALVEDIRKSYMKSQGIEEPVDGDIVKEEQKDG